ncbi:TPA: hypothetical protein JBF73_07855 [Legionella pneumophila]|nr:hypothetical protein [Legionella pneumophila]
MSIDKVKKQATILKEYLKEANIEMSHSSCLHAVAKIHGYKNWNTLSALYNLSDTFSLPLVTDSPNFRSKPIHVSEDIYSIKHNTPLSSYSHDLLDAILLNTIDNSLIVKKIHPNIFLWNKWSMEQLLDALHELKQASLISFTHDQSNNLIVSINPRYFWKGVTKKHEEAVKIFDLSCFIAHELLANHDITVDITAIIAFAEESKNIAWVKQAFLTWNSNKEYDVKQSENLLQYLLNNLTKYMI